MVPPHNGILSGAITKKEVDIFYALIEKDVQDTVLHEKGMCQNNVYSVLPFL